MKTFIGSKRGVNPDTPLDDELSPLAKNKTKIIHLNETTKVIHLIFFLLS